MIVELRDFANQIAGRVEKAEKDYEMRRKIVELLGIQATFTVENEEKVIYLGCQLGLEVSVVVSSNTRFAAPAVRGHPEPAG